MVDSDKIAIISALCRDIMNMNSQYGDKAFFDYDSAIVGLEIVKEVMQKTVRYPKPEGLPDYSIWYERTYGIEGEPDPYVFNGFMDPEDFERWQDLMLGVEPDKD